MFARDDSSGVLLHHGIHDKENSSLVSVVSGRGLGAGGKNALQPAQQPGSVRKALGNITNTTTKQQSKGGSSSAAPEKGGKAAPVRRAFGVDITNSGTLKHSGPPSEPGAKHRPLQALDSGIQAPSQQPQASVKPQLPKSKAELYAEGGVERLAGKSFKEQEAERLQREQHDMDLRVKQLTSALSTWKPQGLGVGGYSDFEEEDLGELSMTPSRLQLYRQSGPSHSAGSEDVPLLLPDSPPTTATCLAGGSQTTGIQQRAPFITILPDPELDFDFDELM